MILYFKKIQKKSLVLVPISLNKNSIPSCLINLINDFYFITFIVKYYGIQTLCKIQYCSFLQKINKFINFNYIN